MFYRVLYIPGGAGFLPSTESTKNLLAVTLVAKFMAVQTTASPGEKQDLTTMHSEFTAPLLPPKQRNGNRKNENLANLYQVYHSGDPSDFGDPTKNGSIFDLEIREGSF